MLPPTATKGIVAGSTCLLDKLMRRSLVGNIYPESEEFRSKLKRMLQTPVSVYAGFDATANSLHVGNLATIMNLIHFYRRGHQVICVIGDATTRIGDPSGHSRDRKEMDVEIIEENAKSLESTIARLFENHDKYFGMPTKRNQIKIKPLIIRNSEWYEGKKVVDFVADVFRRVRVGGLLHKKSISERLKTQEGMNMSEFCYQIFQAYDWMELRERYDCRLQVGGADQAGNIYTGFDMLKKLGHTDAIGLLTPLITDSVTGKKLGKTSSDRQEPNGNIWLNPERTSPFQLYQFFHRTPDQDVERFLKVFSLYDDKCIQDLIYNHLKNSEDVWHCQRKLADHVCQLVHGESGLNSAKRLTHAFFQKNPLDIAKLNDEELSQLFEKDSIIFMLHREGLTVLDLIRKAGCFKNDLDAERLISAQGLRINGVLVTSYNVSITNDLIIGNNVTIMKVGKKNYFLFKWLQ